MDGLQKEVDGELTKEENEQFESSCRAVQDKKMVGIQEHNVTPGLIQSQGQRQKNAAYLMKII
eukprot:6774570-Karenia_brevis.AAC.1